MKFLCVPCDSQMRMRATEENEPGSLSVVYECPECGYEMAMLTNQHETDMVRSLGIKPLNSGWFVGYTNEAKAKVARCACVPNAVPNVNDGIK